MRIEKEQIVCGSINGIKEQAEKPRQEPADLSDMSLDGPVAYKSRLVDPRTAILDSY